MSHDGAARSAAVPMSNTRADASRRNGAKSRGPRTAEGKARSRLNAIKHGMRAAMHVVLPDENAVEFHALQEALMDELAPEGALQTVLARRVAVAAWRLARADRMEIELFEERRWENAGVGMALIRDGNGTRSFETLMRYRNAAMAEFMRALRTLKALQAEQIAEQAAGAQVVELPPRQPRAPARLPSRPAPNEPEHRALNECVIPDRSGRGRTLHEPAAYWMPNEPEPGRDRREAAAASPRHAMPPEPRASPGRSSRTRTSREPGVWAWMNPLSR
jgi:hypothetical protein